MEYMTLVYFGLSPVSLCLALTFIDGYCISVYMLWLAAGFMYPIDLDTYTFNCAVLIALQFFQFCYRSYAVKVVKFTTTLPMFKYTIL